MKKDIEERVHDAPCRLGFLSHNNLQTGSARKGTPGQVLPNRSVLTDKS